MNKNIISKEKPDIDSVYNYIKNNFSRDLNNYPLYKPPSDSLSFIELEDDDYGSKNILLLKSKTNALKTEENHSNVKKKKTLLNNSYNINHNFLQSSKLINKFENLKNEFEDYEKANNGVFSISLFEDMLDEIDINPAVIKIIINYITTKSKKTILNFDIFKEVMILLSEDNSINDSKKSKSNLISGFFTIYSYPDDYITKTKLIYQKQN